MLICPNGHKLGTEDFPDDFSVCPYCKAELVAKQEKTKPNVCSVCGLELDPDWAVCPKCGTEIHNAAEPTECAAEPKPEVAQKLDMDNLGQYSLGILMAEAEKTNQPELQYEVSVRFFDGYEKLSSNKEYLNENDLKRLRKSFEWAQKAANQNYAPALRFLCDNHSFWLLDKGIDMTKAFECYKKAAKLEYAPAFFALGECYYLGTGTDEDGHNAFKFFSKAADYGIDEAMKSLFFCYVLGLGVEKNEREGFNLLKMYCKKCPDDEDGQFFLGYAYKDGIGTAVDYDKAIQCYKKAPNSREALFDLGLCFLNKENPDKAYLNIKKAAELEHPEAMYYLSLFYKQGVVVNQNDEKADEWYNRAIEAGYEPDEENYEANNSLGSVLGKAAKKFLDWLSD